MLSLRVVAVSSLVMLAIACGGYSDSPASPSPPPPASNPGATPTSVTIPIGAENLGARAFTPGEIGIVVGGSVTWVNADRVTHTSRSNAPGWNSGNIAPGRQFSSVFPNAGTFPYHCSIHPDMVGTVVVR